MKYLLNKQFYLHLVIWSSDFIVFSVNGFVVASRAFHTCKKESNINKKKGFMHTGYVMEKYTEKHFFVEGF